MTAPADVTRELINEMRKLRHAIERTQRALMNQKDAACYVGYSTPVFRALVAAKVFPQTKLSDYLEPRYARVVLDRIIAEHTAEVPHA